MQLNNSSMEELFIDVKNQISKPSTNMRNSMHDGRWETNSGAPSKSVRDAQDTSIRLLNRDGLGSLENRRMSTIGKIE